jgi:hypothetical protein
MKMMGWLSTGVLSLLLVGSTAVVAQDKPEDKPEDRPKQQDAKPEDRPRQGDEDKPRNVKPEDSKRQDAKTQDRENGRENARAENTRPAGKRVDRIPDDKFRANFGRQHVTVISQPVIIEGRPSFQFGGYWFGLSAGWPVGWAYTDQVYVDYIDGEYFLFDMVHPGVRIALIVTL